MAALTLTLPEATYCQLVALSQFKEVSLEEAAVQLLEAELPLALEDADDVRHASVIVARVRSGDEPVYSAGEVWEALARQDG